jgi:hypothetical protein
MEKKNNPVTDGRSAYQAGDRGFWPGRAPGLIAGLVSKSAIAGGLGARSSRPGPRADADVTLNNASVAVSEACGGGHPDLRSVVVRVG